MTEVTFIWTFTGKWQKSHLPALHWKMTEVTFTCTFTGKWQKSHLLALSLENDRSHIYLHFHWKMTEVTFTCTFTGKWQKSHLLALSLENDRSHIYLHFHWKMTVVIFTWTFIGKWQKSYLPALSQENDRNTINLHIASPRVSPPYMSTLACSIPCWRTNFGVFSIYFTAFWCFFNLFYSIAKGVIALNVVCMKWSKQVLLDGQSC